MSFSKDGKQFVDVRSTDTFENGLSGEWSGKKVSDKVGNCAHRKDLDGAKTGQDTLAKSLTDDGRALVYGINFDFNSDKIKPESKTSLDQIVAVLKQNAGWKMLIEGHTDNIGGDAFNKDLSEKRAAAVKTFLAAAGIEEGRLSVAGLGMSKPIGSNETEHGRAQNRRVELVKQ
jgi:outer membrane protein OmpA-like peptidoglycan-associated protein